LYGASQLSFLTPKFFSTPFIYDDDLSWKENYQEWLNITNKELKAWGEEELSYVDGMRTFAKQWGFKSKHAERSKDGTTH